MTAKQLALLRYICGYQEAHGYSPSYAEMRDAMGLRSKSGIHRFLASMEERGLIALPTKRGTRWALLPRAIEVLRPVPVPHAPDGAALYMATWIG